MFPFKYKRRIGNVSFNDIEGSALVYYTKKDDDSCGVILIQRIVILTMILMPMQGSCLTMDNAIPAIPTRY